MGISVLRELSLLMVIIYLTSVRFCNLKKRLTFCSVMVASSWRVIPLAVAIVLAVCRVNEGSFLLPR